MPGCYVLINILKSLWLQRDYNLQLSWKELTDDLWLHAHCAVLREHQEKEQTPRHAPQCGEQALSAAGEEAGLASKLSE